MKEQLEEARLLTPAHPLTYFKIQKYYQNELKFNGVYSRKNLPEIKDGAYVINLNEYDNSVGARRIALDVNVNNSLIVLELNIFRKKLKNS